MLNSYFWFINNAAKMATLINLRGNKICVEKLFSHGFYFHTDDYHFLIKDFAKNN